MVGGEDSRATPELPTRKPAASSTLCLSWTAVTSISLPLGFLLMALFSLAIQSFNTTPLPSSSLEYHISDSLNQFSDNGTYLNAAVATDSGLCSKVGADILKKGDLPWMLPSQAFSVLVLLICTPQELEGEDLCCIMRLRPSKCLHWTTEKSHLFLQSGLSVGVPGELRGMEMAWKRWGRLRWEDLFRPAIKIARQGFPISPAVSRAIKYREEFIFSGKFPGLYELLAPNGRLLQENDMLKRPLYANTLELIAWHGADFFYNSEFTNMMVQELRNEHGSVVTEEDFRIYLSVMRKVTKSYIGGLRVHSVSAPSSGAVIGLLLNILDRFDFAARDYDSPLAYHRIVEAFKFAYAQRLKLGDPLYNLTVNDASYFMLDLTTAREMFSRITDDATHNQDYYTWPRETSQNEASNHGASHVSILASNGDAVAATGTINLYFGSLIRSKTSGIIFNDEMDDFSYPSRASPHSYKQAENNHIEPGKRPLSSTCPAILLDDEGHVRMVVGASGGFRMTTATAQAILNTITFKKPLNKSISLPRLHHQLFPNYILVESNFPENVKAFLRSKGHRLVEDSPEAGAVVQAITRDEDGYIYATCDARKGGSPAGY